MHHNRTSDEKILIQFAEDQGFDIIEVMRAVERLQHCIDAQLTDYCTIEEEGD